MMRRFFAEPERCKGSHIELDERESQHLAQVLRARVGEGIVVLDGHGGIFECEVEKISKRSVTAAVRSRTRVDPLPYSIILVQAIPKGKVMEWIVQKATELGAKRILPIITERTVVEIEKESASGKVEKWRGIAIESIKQCGSPYLPTIDEPIAFTEALKRVSEGAIVASLQQGAREIWELQLKNHAQIWVGPEGDFAPDEMQRLVEKGVRPITLGPLVLRCDTAAVCSLALAAEKLRQTVIL
jgi:16S rRNA (uracil1498-N3)-methyltransferase